MPSYIKSITTTGGDTYQFKDDRVDNIAVSQIETTGTAIATFTDAEGQDTTIYAPNGGEKTTWYGTSSTTASTAAKVVTCADFTLTKGAIIAILFSTANTAATPTLNVNSTGAKEIRIGSTAPNGTTNVLRWSANTLLTFIYGGSYYHYISAKTASGYASSDGGGSWYGSSSTTANTATKTATITNYRLTVGTRVSIRFGYANTVDTLIKLNINSTGAMAIMHDGVDTDNNPLLWDAGEVLTFVYDGTTYNFISRSKSDGGGSEVSVTQTQTSGTEIGSITVDEIETKLYAPPQQSVPWVSFDDLTYPISFTTNPSTTYTVVVASSDTIKNASEVLVQLGSRFLHFFNMGTTETLSVNFIPDTSTSAAVTSSYSAGADCQIDFTTGMIQARQYMKKSSGSAYHIYGIWYRVDPNVLADANSTPY